MFVRIARINRNDMFPAGSSTGRERDRILRYGFVMPEFAVELSNVTKTFGTNTAVRDLDLAIPSGSVYGFIGPNGSGKTTTIRMILRIFFPDRGRVTILGESDGKCADDRVGYLPEERGLYRRMKGSRSAAVLCKAEGLSGFQWRNQLLAESSRRCRLGNQEDRDPVEGHDPEGSVHGRCDCPPETTDP